MVPLDRSAQRARTRRVPCALALVALAAGLFGCAGSSDATEQALGRFEGELARLRADNGALSERLEALELRAAKQGGARTSDREPQGPVEARQGDRPALEVVRLVPPGSEDEPPLDDGSPERAAERENLAKAEFAKGESLLTAKKYDAALNAFAGFVVRFPEHPRTAEATLRRGECYLHKGEPARAAEQLEAGLALSPQAPDAPRALALLAQAYQRAGDKTAAGRARDRLRRDFPDHSASK